MQPTLLARPFHREGWIFEEKIDGWRMLAFKEGDHVRLMSRQGRDHTKRFPDLVKSIRALAPACPPYARQSTTTTCRPSEAA